MQDRSLTVPQILNFPMFPTGNSEGETINPSVVKASFPPSTCKTAASSLVSSGLAKCSLNTLSINSDEKRIIGTWYSEEENQTVCFYEDGTGEVDGIPFEWIILEDKQLKCTFSLFGSEVFDYQITGSKLILEDEDEHSEYLKQ